MKNVIENLIMIIKTRKSIVDLCADTKISALDLDSLEFVYLFVEIEEKFKIEFTMNDIVDSEAYTIKELARRIIKLLEIRNNNTIYVGEKNGKNIDYR